MLTERSQRWKTLRIVGAAAAALFIGAWTLPPVIEEGGAWASVEDIDAIRTMTVEINWPTGEIEDEQYCMAYAQVYNGSYPFTYQWGGQFSGTNVYVDGNTSSSRGSYLTLRVIDSSSPPDTVTGYTSWSWGDFNEDCGI